MMDRDFTQKQLQALEDLRRDHPVGTRIELCTKNHSFDRGTIVKWKSCEILIVDWDGLDGPGTGHQSELSAWLLEEKDEDSSGFGFKKLSVLELLSELE